MTCSICAKEIALTERMAYQIVGYEYERRQGGTNVVHLRKRTGNVAHRDCVERTKRMPEGQIELW